MPRSRRKESSMAEDLFDMLLVLPVWAGPVLAMFVFVLLHWVVPAAIGRSAEPGSTTGGAFTVFATVAAGAAPWVSAGVLLMWIGAEIKKRVRGLRLDRQTGAASIRELGWREFEALLSEAFRRQGFTAEHTGSSGPDGGVDHRLIKAGAVTLVQCKHWKAQQVGVKIVRELLGVVSSERAQSGVVITSGTFTSDAAEFASKNPIRLIDGRELVAMIGEVQKSGRIARAGAEPSVGASPPAAATPSASEITCPACGAAMVLRVAKRGPNAGGPFLGCSRYPECRGTRNLD